VIGMHRRIAVLQALDQVAGGEAQRVLVDRELDRRCALVLLVDERDRGALYALEAVGDLLAELEVAGMPLVRVLVEEEPDISQF